MDYIGIDIGGTKCAVVKGNLKDGVKEKIRFATTDRDSALRDIFAAVERLMPAAAIGVSCGGPLDERTGVIISPPNLPDWRDVRITDMLSERFGIPARLLNDANAGALAEWRFGAGQGCENMVFLTFGTGLGAGVIINSRLYSGANGNAGEVGHVRLAEDGPLGYGKRGSFEGFCSGGGITRLAKEMGKDALLSGRPMSFARSEEELDSLTTKSLAEMALGGDADAMAVFDKSAQRLGEGLSVLIDVLNPDRIVIGGVYARAERLFLEGMRRSLEREALSCSLEACRIIPAALGESIGDIAALCAAFEAV